MSKIIQPNGMKTDDVVIIETLGIVDGEENILFHVGEIQRDGDKEVVVSVTQIKGVAILASAVNDQVRQDLREGLLQDWLNHKYGMITLRNEQTKLLTN